MVYNLKTRPQPQWITGAGTEDPEGLNGEAAVFAGVFIGDIHPFHKNRQSVVDIVTAADIPLAVIIDKYRIAASAIGERLHKFVALIIGNPKLQGTLFVKGHQVARIAQTFLLLLATQFPVDNRLRLIGMSVRPQRSF